MSVEAPKVEETTPVTKPVESVETPATTSTETPVAAEPITAEPIKQTSALSPLTKDHTKTEEATAAPEVIAATEGVLGYKEPGLFK